MSHVLITTRSYATGDVDTEQLLLAAGHTVERGPASHPVDSMRESLARADAWIAGTGPIGDEHLACAPRLQVIARYGVGTDAVDLTAANARGVVVTNTPGANSAAVADHSLALLLAALRGVVAGDRRVRAGDWQVERARELGSLTVGLVGYGRIGRLVAQRLLGFGATVRAMDPIVSQADMHSSGVIADEGRLPADVDVVSLHAPGTATIVDREWLARVRPGLILVNTARAALVDEDAVADALRSNQVSLYAADTLRTEASTIGSPLLDVDFADRVVVTPHSAAQTVEAVDRMGVVSTDAVLAVLAGRKPDNVVNPPE